MRIFSEAVLTTLIKPSKNMEYGVDIRECSPPPPTLQANILEYLKNTMKEHTFIYLEPKTCQWREKVNSLGNTEVILITSKKYFIPSYNDDTLYIPHLDGTACTVMNSLDRTAFSKKQRILLASVFRP